MDRWRTWPTVPGGVSFPCTHSKTALSASRALASSSTFRVSSTWFRHNDVYASLAPSESSTLIVAAMRGIVFERCWKPAILTWRRCRPASATILHITVLCREMVLTQNHRVWRGPVIARCSSLRFHASRCIGFVRTGTTKAVAVSPVDSYIPLHNMLRVTFGGVLQWSCYGLGYGKKCAHRC